MEVREFSKSKSFAADVKSRVLAAARLTGSSMNTRHWRFVIVQDKENSKRRGPQGRGGDADSRFHDGIVPIAQPG
ncbi:MAG: nitroreductase family protein [Nitrososphaerales archaeon]